MYFLTESESKPFYLSSRISNRFFSRYSNTRYRRFFLFMKNLIYLNYRLTYFLKASIKVTMLSYFRVLSILTSRNVVFLTISSSSDSLNFLMATILNVIIDRGILDLTYLCRHYLCFWLCKQYHKHPRLRYLIFHIYSSMI
jgi:hypothetical protein